MTLCQNYLIFIPSAEDENAESIHIVDLSSEDGENKTILINNVVGNIDRIFIPPSLTPYIVKFIAYNPYQECLLVASTNDLIIAQVTKEQLKESDSIDIEGENIDIITFDVKI